MVLSLYSLLEATLLVINGIAVLNEERFLSKVGWDRNSIMMSASNSPYGGGGFGAGGGGQPPTMTAKMQLLNMLHSIRTVARVPLILINVIVIIFKLIFG